MSAADGYPTAEAPAGGAVEIVPRGPFSLRAATRFGEGWSSDVGAGGAQPGSPPSDEGPVALRLTFLVDDWHGAAEVELRQGEDDASVAVEVLATVGEPDLDRVRGQALRTVSLDHDGTGWRDLGAREPVIGALQAAVGLLRPVLFPSPYEAACWFVLTQRSRMAQMARVRERLATEEGWEVGGTAVFPAPERLLALDAIPGVPGEKVRRLHDVAEAALVGRLDAATLLAVPADEALASLRELHGIGPFAAEGILLRGAGAVDLLPFSEARVRAAAARAYDLDEVLDDAAWAALGDRFRPFRGWAAVLLRASAGRG